MRETKTTIVECRSCGGKLRIPVMENKIRFACPTCKANYFARNGTVIDNIEQTPKAEPTPKVEPVPKVKPTPKGEPSPEAEPAPKRDSAPGQGTKGKAKNPWRTVSIVLAAALVVFGFKYYADTRDHADQRSSVNSLITDMQQELTKSGSDIDFDKIKSLLTPETRRNFEAFIESQFLHKDSASRAILATFVNSLETQEIHQTVKIRYKLPSGDTSYFRVEYVPDGIGYLMNVDLKDFTQ
jgi:predicted RNA-binding Zn-ribbon protein involved in translation (DUF1610 family)